VSKQPDIADAINTEVPDITVEIKKKRAVLTFDQRVERLITPQRNAFKRATVRAEKARAEADAAEAELRKAKADLERAQRLASSEDATP
jgi:multidrug efflux pump subunit AcrA (membrane-fusion protein)